MNKYLITESHITLYQAFAVDSAQALEMVKRKAYRPAGSETEEGFSTIIPAKPLIKYTVVDAPPTSGEIGEK